MKTKTKQTTRTGTESDKWSSNEGISLGRGNGGIEGGKVQGRRSMVSRHKVNRER